MATLTISEVFQQALNHHRAGELLQAEKIYNAILQIQPNHPAANHNLGFLLVTIQKPELALPFLKKALDMDQTQPPFWLDYIETLIHLNQLELANTVLTQGIEKGLRGEQTAALVERLKKAIKKASSLNLIASKNVLKNTKQLPPKIVKKLSNLYHQNNYIELEIYARKLLDKYTNEGYSSKMLSLALAQMNRLPEAISIMRDVVVLLPNDSEVYANLGRALLEDNQLVEAEIYLRRGLKIGKSFDILFNLGLVLQKQNRLPEAVENFINGLKIQPKNEAALSNLGSVYQLMNHMDEAENFYKLALNQNPYCFESLKNWLFIQAYNSKDTPEFLLNEAIRYGEIVSKEVKQRFTKWKCEEQPNNLKIGFVSGDFCNHPVAYFLESILNALQHYNCKAIAYSTVDKIDEVTDRIMPFFYEWKSIFKLSDESAAKLIYDDGVHVLIDLSGHTAHGRLPLFSWKSAPIQVTWLGYFATTGINEIDYILGDSFVTPVEEAHFFIEKIWRLPDSYFCFTTPNFSIEVSQLPAIENHFITFGCFNNLNKINDAVVELWARILHAVPDSKLLLKHKQLDDKTVCKNIFARFEMHGIKIDKLILEGGSLREDFLKSYQRVDISLDPFPYPGGTTSVESLWMAVPVLTLQGDRFLSHVGESISYNAGLIDWIAEDVEDYVAKAVSFTKDIHALNQLRQRLRNQVLNSPLFNADRFAKNFNSAMWGMWYEFTQLPDKTLM